MATAKISWLVIACALFLVVVNGADPDPLQDYCVADLKSTVVVNGFPCKPRDTVTAKDFTFTGLRKPADPINVSETGATVTIAFVPQLPGLNTLGIVHARLDFAVGGVIPVHTHPRATETLYVVKGSVYTGFVSDDNQLFASVLEVGDFTVFPRGLVHFQLNVGNESAITFNTLTSQNPGVLFSVTQILVPNITSAVIEKSFGVNASTVAELRKGIPRYFG